MTSRHRYRDAHVDFSYVWLVKVPKVLSEEWKKTRNGRPVGCMKINHSADTGSILQFTSRLNTPDAIHYPDGPRSYNVSIYSSKRRTKRPDGSKYVIISETKEGDGPSDSILCLEGFTTERLEIRSVLDEYHMGYCKDTIKKMMEKTPRVPRIIQLERAVVMFAAPLPAQKLQPKMFIFGPKEQSELNRIRALSNSTDIDENTEAKRGRKKPTRKPRPEEGVLNDLIFNAFENQKLRQTKDLVRITQQSIHLLKPFLREYCKQPRRGYWELKPEYQYFDHPSKK